MIQITATQLDTLAVPFEASYLARVRRFLQYKTPQLVEHAGLGFEKALEDGLRDARALGIVSEQEQVLHVVLCLLYGAGFTTRAPWAVQVVEAHREAGYASGLSPALMKAGVAAAADPG